MTATTRGSPVGGNDSQGQAPDGQSQPALQQNQVGSLIVKAMLVYLLRVQISHVLNN